MKYLKISILPLLVIAIGFAIYRFIVHKRWPKAQNTKYEVVAAFPDLPAFSNPVELTGANDGTDRLFIVEQKGKIYQFLNKGDVNNAKLFLDITDRVSSGGEMGLLGLAFHPDFKHTGYFYVNYTRRKPWLSTVIARFKVSPTNANLVDPKSEQILLTYEQPYDNHNGGKVAFGNDNYLYIAAGDGGSWGDPHGNAQNKTSLLGKILRIDINKTDGEKKYAIPADNPFKGNKQNFKEEIFAYGMRNPWRFSFDRTTGLLWAGDVGQNQKEEVDIIEKGGNYGWNTMEAEDCYKSGRCDKSPFILPVTSYGRNLGTSITGGYVCRDKSLPALTGKYIYGDYTSGNIWSLSHSGKKATGNGLIASVVPGTLSSFGEDNNHSLYILNHQDGEIYKLVAKK